MKVAAFFRTIWQDGDDVAPFDLILATVHVGAYCLIAEIDGVAVGASFAVRGVFDGQQILHSHVTATTVSGVGYQIKTHQRAWAVEQGIEAITWTFDPLVRRNCYFNFVKLGATAKEYLPNFYGAMTDSINIGDVSDRLLAYWPAVAESTSTDRLREPLAGERLVALPNDIEDLRSENLFEALTWRTSVREALQGPLDSGWTITGMTSDRTALILTAPQEK
ncbi:MAG: hypothetical protein RIS82_157 [Actinomycetota bacterium]